MITGVTATDDGRYQFVEFSADLKSIAAIDTQVPVAGSIGRLCDLSAVGYRRDQSQCA